MRNWKRAIGCMALVVGAMSGVAAADTVTAELTGLNPYVGGDLHLANYGTVDGGVGNILWQGVSTNPVPFGGAFGTYCIDLIQDINFFNTYTFVEEPIQDAPKSGAYPTGVPTTGMGLTKADEIEALYGVDYKKTLGSGAGLDCEAFQLAIWNIIYDTDASVSQGAGSFYAINNSGLDAGAITLANTFLGDALNPGNQRYDMTNLIALVGLNGAQDQIAVVPVPTPASGKAAAAILAGYAIYRWRRARILRNAGL
jgi:hypothetical protein